MGQNCPDDIIKEINKVLSIKQPKDKEKEMFDDQQVEELSLWDRVFKRIMGDSNEPITEEEFDVKFPKFLMQTMAQHMSTTYEELRKNFIERINYFRKPENIEASRSEFEGFKQRMIEFALNYKNKREKSR